MAGPGTAEAGGAVADASPAPGVCGSTVASGEDGVLLGGGSVAPGIDVASGIVGDWVAVGTRCVGLGDEVPVAGTGVADESGSGVGVRGSGVGPITLVGGGMVAVAEGVTGGGVGVMVGIVWFSD